MSEFEQDEQLSAEPGVCIHLPKPQKAAATEYPFEALPIPEPELEKDEEGVVHNFWSGVPADFWNTRYKALKKSDFAEEWQYFQYKYEETEQRLKEAELRRDNARNGLTAKSAAIQRRAVAMANKLKQIAAQLAAAGVDVDSLLAAQGTAVEELVKEVQEV